MNKTNTNQLKVFILYDTKQTDFMIEFQRLFLFFKFFNKLKRERKTEQTEMYLSMLERICK